MESRLAVFLRMEPKLPLTEGLLIMGLFKAGSSSSSSTISTVVMEEDFCMVGDFGRLLVRARKVDFFIGIGVSFSEGNAMVGCSTIDESDSTELSELTDDLLLALIIILEPCLGGLVIIGVIGSPECFVGVLLDVCNCKIGGDANFSF